MLRLLGGAEAVEVLFRPPGVLFNLLRGDADSPTRVADTCVKLLESILPVANLSLNFEQL